jgi:hypothetical protein
MKIKRTSPLTGQINVREINVTEAQLLLWENGALIQNAMPNVSSEDREFIKTGFTPEDWEMMFGKDE